MSTAELPVSLRRSRRMHDVMMTKSAQNSITNCQPNRSSSRESHWGSENEDGHFPDRTILSKQSDNSDQNSRIDPNPSDIILANIDNTVSHDTEQINDIEQNLEVQSCVDVNTSSRLENPDHNLVGLTNQSHSDTTIISGPANSVANTIVSSDPLLYIKGVNGCNIMTNPCKVFAALRRIEPRLGAHQITKDARQGSLKIKCTDISQFRILERIDRLDDLDVSVTSICPSNSQPPTSTQSVIIFGVSLDTSDSEIMNDSKAIRVRRLPDFKSGKQFSTNVVLTFDCQPPGFIQLGHSVSNGPILKWFIP